MPVQPIPPGYHSITPYLIVSDGPKAIEFYKQAFGATEKLRLDGPDGKLMHAEVQIGDSIVMLSGEWPDMGYVGPTTLGGTPVSLMIYVPNVDEVFARALAAGAKEKKPVADQFYGDRTGTLADPFGHVWSIATHTEDLTQAEIDARFRKMMEGGK